MLSTLALLLAAVISVTPRGVLQLVAPLGVHSHAGGGADPQAGGIQGDARIIPTTV